jgi:glycosyltransferase involved in cell wall biosynthesis
MVSAVLDWDLSRPLDEVTTIPGCDNVVALVRWRGRPLARLRLNTLHGKIDNMSVWRAAQKELGNSLTQEVLPDLTPLLGVKLGRKPDAPSCSIVVCTRDRPADLRRCLESICLGLRPGDEVVVVDNAPSDESTAECAREFPVRYVKEPRKGLNWARARGLREAGCEVVAFTDDDVTVDCEWIAGMAEPFTDPAVGGVTGLIMPAELETAAQAMFETYGGFVCHFERRSFHASTTPPSSAGQIGAGASMAFRRGLGLDLALFDWEMDCGTRSRSGGDHYAFYRALRAGHTIIFNPKAVCWHRHRRTEKELRTTLYGYSVGVYTFLLRCLLMHRDLSAIRVGTAWFLQHHLRNLWAGLRGKPDVLPSRITLDEIRGVFAAPLAYRAVRRAESRVHAIALKGAGR